MNTRSHTKRIARNPRIVILGKYGSKNAGDEAILTTILADIAELCEAPEVVVLSEDPVWTARTYDCRSAWMSIFSPRALYWLVTADVVILGGGGLLQDNFSLFNIPRYTLPAIIAKAAARRLIVYAVGAGPLTTFLGKALVRACCNRANGVTVRDVASERALHELNHKLQIQLAVDPVISYDPLAVNSKRREEVTRQTSTSQRPTVAICPAFAFYFTSGFGLSTFIPTDYRIKWKLLPRDFQQRFHGLAAALANMADWAVSELDAKIVLLPMWYKRDSLVIDCILDNMKNGSDAVTFDEDLTPASILCTLSSCDALVGMRLHSLIFATTIGLPFVGVPYSSKVSQFIERVGMQEYSIDANEAVGPQLIDRVAKLVKHHGELRKHLLNKASQLREFHAVTRSLLARELAATAQHNGAPPTAETRQP